MIVNVFDTGVSRAADVYEYLHSGTDANGNDRSVNPVALRGNPWRMGRLIDECHRKWRYTSGVISFSEFDHPDEDVQTKIMDAFEDFAFAGKDPSTWDIYWVRHEDKGRVELHFVIPRVDLETGQDLNAFQRGWDAHWRPWQRDICFQYGLADPHSRRKVTASPKAKRETDRRKELRAGIYNEIEAGFKANIINSRERLIEILSDAGEVTRQSERTISVRFPKETRPIRLEGPIFERQFNFETGSCDPEIPRGGQRRSREKSPFRRDRDDAFERRRQFFDEHRRKARRNDQKLRAFLERISDIHDERDGPTRDRDTEPLETETQTFERDSEAQQNRSDKGSAPLLDDSGRADSVWKDRRGDRDLIGDDPSSHAGTPMDSLDDRKADPHRKGGTFGNAGENLGGTGNVSELQQPDEWGDNHTRRRTNAADVAPRTATESTRRQHAESSSEPGTQQPILDRLDGIPEHAIARLAGRRRSRARAIDHLDQSTRHRTDRAAHLYRTALETAQRIARLVKSAIGAIKGKFLNGP